MKIYTKTGDDGKTSLLSKQRVFKDHARVHAYGTVDEANAAMGLARSLVKDKLWASQLIHDIQQELILLNADLATEGVEGSGRITEEHVKKLEQSIDIIGNKLFPQPSFVSPGDNTASAALDLARTIVRRAEREVVHLSHSSVVPRQVALYLNRLSDLLFVLARAIEQENLISTVKNVVIQVMKVLPESKGKVLPESKEGLKLDLLSRAKAALAAAEKKSLEIGVPMVIAIVDNGGNLIVQERMDGALLASISLALDKAYTAVALKMPTSNLAKEVVPGQQLYGINTTNNGRLVTFGGGIPVFDKGEIIAGIGVSGGTVEQDMIVAEAGLAAW